MNAPRFEAKECRARVAQLSPRLLEVLRMLSEGKSQKQIAADMGLSENTVRVYLERVYSVLGVPNAVLAARIAYEAEVV